MKHSIWIAVSLVALSLAGCGKKSEPVPTSEASDGLAVTSEPAVAISPGQTFANTAASSDMFEVEASRLAATKAVSAKTKRFAEQMIKAHTESTTKLKAAAASASPAITPVPQLTTTQQQTLHALGAKSGAEFDTAYAQAQVDAHQAALETLKAYSLAGDVPTLKAYAAAVVPIVTAHLNMATAL